jgi:hypothetical protein
MTFIWWSHSAKVMSGHVPLPMFYYQNYRVDFTNIWYWVFYITRTVLGYGLDDQDSRVRFPAGVGNFSLHHRIQNGSGAHPPSYPMGTEGSFPGVKAARGVSLTTHLHLVPRSKNEWSYTSIPQYAFMAWRSVKAQGQFYLYWVHFGNIWYWVFYITNLLNTYLLTYFYSLHGATYSLKSW